MREEEGEEKVERCEKAKEGERVARVSGLVLP